MINMRYLKKHLLLFLFIFFISNNFVFAEVKTIYNSSNFNYSNTYSYFNLNNSSVEIASINNFVPGRTDFIDFYGYENFVLNKTYSLTINFMDRDLENSVTSSNIEIYTCSSQQCNKSTIVSFEKSHNSGYSSSINLKFNPIFVGNYFHIIIDGKGGYITGVTNFGIRNVELTSSNENQDLIDSQYNNTNNIINNNNNNTQNIIDNNNNNTQNIIDNQNQNNEQLKDTIKEQISACRDSYNLIDKNEVSVGSISNTGIFVSGGDSSSTINILDIGKGTFTISNGHLEKVCFYKDDNSFNNCVSLNLPSSSLQYTFTLSNFGKVRLQFRSSDLGDLMLNKGSSALNYEPYGEICVNKIDETNNQLGNINGTLNNDNIDDNGIASAFESFNDYLDDNSTITQLITLPITLYTAILNNVNGVCSPFNLGSLFGTDLILPCINISQYLGFSLWSMIDIIISGFAIFAISKKMIKVFNNFSSLREGDVIND